MKKLVAALAGVGILVVIFGTIYGVSQQVQRSDANMPQIQLAEDEAARINSGFDSQVRLALAPVNIRDSLVPFLIIYDKNGKVISSSGYINGKVPQTTMGMLTASKGKDYSAVTWEPQKNVRIAAVTVAAKDYYVLSGRSLTEVERNEARTFQLAFIGGVVALMLLGVAITAKIAGPEH